MITNNKSPQYIKISDEYLREGGFLSEEQKNKKPKAGPPGKENKFTMIKLDEKYLEELRREAIQPVYKNFSATSGPPRPNSVSKRESIANGVYNIKKSTTTICRRTPNVHKGINKESVCNASKVKTEVPNKAEMKFIPMPTDIFETFEKEFSKVNVRKELFKMPKSNRKSTGKLPSRSRPTLSGKFFKAPKTNIKTMVSYNSPLLDMDKVEAVFKNSSLKSVENTQPYLSLQTPSRLSIVEEEQQSLTPSTSGNTSKTEHDKGRSSTSSNTEFEAMERMCNNQEAKKVNEQINKILGIIKTDQEQLKKYIEANDQRMSEIARMLNEIVTKTSEGNTENLTKAHSKPKTPNRTLFKTGVISNKSCDLRKNVLSMSLGNTPNKQKAEIMYNSLRDKYGILETPKFDKKTPKKGNINFSAKIQQQCLMLLDTPQQKKSEKS